VRGSNNGGNSVSSDSLSLRFYDEAAVAEVLQELGFSGGDAVQQQGPAAGGRVLRSTSLGLSDDGGPGLPVAGASGRAAAAAASGGQQYAGGGGGFGSSSSSSSGTAGRSFPDFGGVLAPTGGCRL